MEVTSVKQLSHIEIEQLLSNSINLGNSFYRRSTFQTLTKQEPLIKGTITLEHDSLVFRFPEVHNDAVLRIDFQRTLRIPDDNREYPLPPGLGRFPLQHIDDYAGNVPASWVDHGGIFLPMYQAEALWINFSSPNNYMFAVKVAAGKINAVTGESWSNKLSSTPQDYVVVPKQPWLDGFCIGKGLIRQFVAMPLGQDYTAEEQLTGKAEHGGIQIVAYPIKADIYEESQRITVCESKSLSCMNLDMGLAPGGIMKQEIYKDPYGYEAWEQTTSSRCFVHILNSMQYANITGNAPPTKPISAQEYTKAGLPWFEYYDTDAKVLNGTQKLSKLDGVAAKGIKKGEKPLSENDPVNVVDVKKLSMLGGEMSELKKFGKKVMIVGFIMFAAAQSDWFYYEEYLLWFGMALSIVGIVIIGVSIYLANRCK